MSDLAQQLIEENKKTKDPYLDLGNCGLTELPEELLDCDWLETLILSSEWNEYDFEKRRWEDKKSPNEGKPNNIRALPPALPRLLLLKKLIVRGAYEQWELSDLSPLKNLQSLQSLNVSETQVADLSPLKDLQSLQSLNVSSTQIADLSPLKNLQSLQSLYISSTQVADLSPLKDLQSLQSLNVSSTQIADLSPLKDLQSLQSLNVYSTQVADLSPLKNLQSLQSLYVSSTQVADLSPLKNLQSLQYLNVSSTQIADLSPLKNLQSLQYLNVSSTQVADLSPLKNLQSLQSLYVYSTQVADLSPLKNLQSLQQLDVSSTQVADLSPLKDLQSLKQLDVYSTQVADLSPLKNLQSLKSLYVFSTQVADLSPLKDLQSLQFLYVFSTQVADLSPLKNLQSLQSLYVSSTPVADLSPLKNLQSLQSLEVSSTPVADLSPLKNLQSLQSLEVSSTQVSDLSPLKDLQSLQSLYVSSTQVADLSPLKNLQSLQSLNVSSTPVADLSPLKNLQSLQSLNVSSTPVADLSPLKNLQSLQQLDVSSTQVADLSPLKERIENGLPVKWETYDPWENSGIYIKGTPLDRSLIAAIKSGNKAVLKYLNKPKERLWEARVLLLGEPRAGKTTLRRKLRSPKATMPTDAESTKGIEIEVETYKCALKRADEVYKMQYHLWDFGGQDMYRLLHQLFVSEQAVYVIVTDTDRNKNEEEIDFWLETIQRLGKDKNGKYGPVILLQNPKTNREGSSFPDLKKRYKDLWLQQENFVINLNRIASDKPEFDQMELSRFRHFKNYLENSFHQLDHLGQDMPRQWVRIRKNLSKLVSENWITLEKFRAICEKEHIKEDKEQEDLLKIFHILGFVLHYDTGLLRGMIILNKEWATDALYRVLDDEIVRANNGWFVKADAKKIWHDKKYQDRESELLLLMQEFKLTYYNETSKKYIVPSKLPEDTEELPEWNTSGNVRLHLRYDWLPRPVATQLIVSLHDNIVQLDEKQQWIWRKGAVLDGKKLDLKDAQVRIMDNWRERQIEIHARGSSCELLIRTVMQKWREVHAPYEDKVSVSKIILCNCEKCQTERQPFEFQYEQVLNAKEKNKPLRCNNSLEDFDAADILRGVFDETTVLVDTLQFKGSRSELLDFIAAGNLEEPLNRLHNSENTLALKARFSHLKDRQTKGIISPEDFNLEWNQLAHVLIQYIYGLQNRTSRMQSI